MQRNSSFFWNTDSWDEDEDVGLVLDEAEEVSRAADPTETSPLLSSSEQEHVAFAPLHDVNAQKTRVLPSPTYSSIEDGTRAVDPPRANRPYSPQHAGLAPSATAHPGIRFQVVWWYVGAVDVVLGHVPMRFRVSLFWNDCDRNDTESMEQPVQTWKMENRMQASFQEELQPSQGKRTTMHVPPLSILNAVNHEVIGSPEVTMIREDTRLMRWTCMYNATLFQGENLRVDNFPHDRHDLCLKLGILAHRRAGGVWDRRKWKLGLATEEDSQGSTRIPHGLLVDHVAIPNFKTVQQHQGLKFEFLPLPLGSGDRTDDMCLQVKLTVVRESRHYDKNVVPVLGVLNLVAISCLPRTFDSATASTELMLSIAFVEVGIRLTVDSHLPGVSYQIKMQRVMNRCFWLLCFLVLESNLNFFLVTKLNWAIKSTNWIDVVAAIGGIIYTVGILADYYGTRHNGRKEE